MDYSDLYEFNTDRGTVVPSYDLVLPGIQEKFKSIFGDDLDVSSATLVGRWIEAYAKTVRSTLGVVSQCANQFNVDMATGVYLDTLAQLFGVTRNAGQKTIVSIQVVCSSQGTVIPAGSLVMSSSTGTMFETDSQITATEQLTDGTYRGYGTASSLEYGDVDGTAGTVDTIQTAVLGWISVTNTSEIQSGSVTESDESFRERIVLTRSVGKNYSDSLVSVLKRLEGVSSAIVLTNGTAFYKSISGLVIHRNTIFVAVRSATTDECYTRIAEAIASVKPVGIAMEQLTDYTSYEDNRITKTVTDPIGGTSSITFFQAISRTVTVKCDVKNWRYGGDDLESAIREIVIAYVSGIDIGGTMYSSVLTEKIVSSISGIYVLDVKFRNPLYATSSDYWLDTYTFDGMHYGITTQSDVTVTVES